ncbi:MAG: nitroreductase family protein [Spirochaetaceae bacterium]|jgi:nitroreductase|nr:nitroreductase family protein [Spirochaetaceae bacterium]
MIQNDALQAFFDRKSVRSFLDKAVPQEIKELIIDAGIAAPSAGNQQLYTIIVLEEQALKEKLALLCDNQPFIATAPFVLVLLADCRRWLDCYHYAGLDPRRPGLGDMLLACEDAVIAAQNMVMAAHFLGLGSCYIGDILENQEEVAALLHLDSWVVPATMLVFGYPTQQAAERNKPKRPPREYLVRKNYYSALSEPELRRLFNDLSPGRDFNQYMTAFCKRKYLSDFAQEMNRSVLCFSAPFTKDQERTE